MKRALVVLVLAMALAALVFPQEPLPTPTPRKEGWLGRMLHRSEKIPQYQDPKLRGLDMAVLILPQPVDLSEVRQLSVKVTLTNLSKRPITLDFVTDQRIEIYLRNSAEEILTKWSDNHAITEKPATVLINPKEHVAYNETIATRELSRNKVFTAEVFFPKYPELRVRQKFMTAP